MTTTILVVDDSELERVLVQGILSKNRAYHVSVAANGEDALRMIERDPPDVVLTDMVMPQMDGVELVGAIRRRFPAIPVILMTAYGDETTAVEAFEAGAASYVPKSRRAERLVETVDRVVEHGKEGESRERLSRCMLEYRCRFALENDPELIRALVAQVETRMAGIGFADTVERIRIGEAVEEALLNAMYHGNLGFTRSELNAARSELDDDLLRSMIDQRCRDPEVGDRRIVVIAQLASDEVRFVIRDEGCGFNPVMTLTHDYSKDSFESGRHRGLTLICSIMDEVRFNEAGNELILRRSVRRQTQDAPEQAHSNT